MERFPSKKEKEVFYYYTGKKEKKWGYRIRYYDALGKRREKSKQGLPSENAAIRELLEVKASIFNGETRQIEKSNLTVAEWMDIWFDSHKTDWKVSTRAAQKIIINNHIKPLLGRYKLSALSRSTYKREFINELLKTKAPRSVHAYHQTFKHAVNEAVEDEILLKNRFRSIKVPLVEPEDNFLTAQELASLLEVVNQNMIITHKTLIYLLAFSGIRIGEALGLQWNDIDFEKNTIRISRTRDEHGVRSPKTKRSNRTLLIDETIIKMLATYKTWTKAHKLKHGIQHQEDQFAFISTYCSPINPSTVRQSFDRIFERHEMDIPEITMHGLRHTHATLLLSQGMPVHSVAERLGNTPQMILQVYGHAIKELEVESVKRFSSALNL